MYNTRTKKMALQYVKIRLTQFIIYEPVSQISTVSQLMSLPAVFKYMAKQAVDCRNMVVTVL